MTTFTISTRDGRTVTSSRILELRDTVCGWYPAMPGERTARLLHLLFKAIREGHVGKAGAIAASLELNFAFAPGSYTPPPPAAQPEYLVPVDPADATNCEACQ